MTREEKNILIDSLTDQLNQYPAFYITDTSELNADKTAQLRKKCYEKEIKLVVVKNTLFLKALEKVGKNDAELVSVLKGSSAIMFSMTSKGPAVLIKEFRKGKGKGKGKDKPVLKAAYVEESVYIGDNQLDALANIKSKNELIADVIALLQSPTKNVISALQSNAGQKIAGIVKSLEERGA